MEIPFVNEAGAYAMGFHVKCVKNSSPKTETNVVTITKTFTTDTFHNE